MPNPTAVPPRTGAAGVGLSSAEAQRRLAERGRLPPPRTSRSAWSIVRANVFTVFNLILVVFGALTLAFGDWRDALFLGVLVGNTMIGVGQEARAKRQLDRLGALVAPVAAVVRDGTPRRLPVAEVVVGDLVRIAPGDQMVADGELVEAVGLRLDESILTGEAAPVERTVGAEARSGSFVVEGAGAYVVTAVGPESFAERIAGQARAFRHPRSPLERALDRLLLSLVAVMVPLGTALAVRLWAGDEPLAEAVPTAVAGIVNLVPEGLILLTSLTFAAAAIRMARHGALAQQLNAIESLASCDVVCLDKTGTLTEPVPGLIETIAAPGVSTPDLERALARLAASPLPRNASLDAIAAALPAPPGPSAHVVPFSSRARWSGAVLEDTTFVLSAPELAPLGALASRAAAEEAAGRRVLALSQTASPLVQASDPPGDLALLGLVVLGERLRGEARSTVAWLRAEGVDLLVLSGDAPATVARIAGAAGVGDGVRALDGRELPADAGALAELVLGAQVVGRIDPDGKRRVVEALRDAGRRVGMVGDGVNDVPALKAARLAVAQGSGSQMARSVADVVLVAGDFAVVPALVQEGRRILRNVQRVAKLFVTKSAFAALLVLSVGMSPLDYPFLPRHLTIVSVLAIGAPGFFLALAPSAGPWRPDGFLRDVARFSVPAGASAAAGVLTAYLIAIHAFDLGLVEARTIATTVLVAFGLVLIVVLEAPGRTDLRWVLALCAAMGALHVLVLALPASREFFRLAVPGAAGVACLAIGIAVGVAGLAATRQRRS
jgi:cation-transporting ATPase E/undecaprenyl-diphosphatase